VSSNSTSSIADQPPSRRQASAPDGAALERQLARWIAEGDEAALAELLDLVGPTLYAVAFKITSNEQHATAALEESLVELWEQRAWLTRLPALSPWIVERSRAWAIALRNGVSPSAPAPVRDRSGDVPLSRRLLRCPQPIRVARGMAALDQLGSPECQALVLALRAGRPVAQIATELGTSVDQVAPLLRDGLHNARHTLEQTLRREAL
jgi:DNA-directed RNA polymerase specialized sigma24 family protein